MQPRPPAPPPRPLSGIEALARSQRQRIERVVLFVGELGESLLQEFEAPRRAPEALPEAERKRLLAFCQRVETLLGRSAGGRDFLARLEGVAATDALRHMREFDLDGLTAAGRGLEGEALALRSALAKLRAQPPAEQAPERQGFLGLMRQLAQAPVVSQARAAMRETGPLPRPGTQPLPRSGTASLADPALLKRKQAFEAARKLAAEVLAYVSPRLELVAFSLEATGLPGKKQPWETITRTLLPRAAEAGLPKAQLSWLTALVRLFYEDMQAVQKGHGAVVQWGEARGLDQEAHLLETALANAPPERQPPMLAAFDLPRLKAATFPLSHLHLTFRDTPTLKTLFPPPAGAAAPTSSLGGRRLQA